MLSACTSTDVHAKDSDLGRGTQELLFLLEEAWLQEPGEKQVNLSAAHVMAEDVLNYELEFEYGHRAFPGSCRWYWPA